MINQSNKNKNRLIHMTWFKREKGFFKNHENDGRGKPPAKFVLRVIFYEQWFQNNKSLCANVGVYLFS